MGRLLELAKRSVKHEPAASTASYTTGGVTLADFATSGRVLTIRSAILGCDVLFAADNALVHNPRNLVVYRASELTLLGGYDSEALRLLHEIKCISGAQITIDD